MPGRQEPRSPSVAALVVAHNAGAILLECLESLERQTRRPDRIILVDNASEDGCASAVDEKFPGVEIIRLEKNTGFAAANNIAARAAGEADYLALLNPDAAAEPDWLENLLDAARRRPDCSMFASLVFNYGDPSIVDGAGDSYHVSGAMWRKGFGAPYLPWMNVEAEVFSPCAAAAMYRNRDFKAAGGFDNDYFCYTEDVDLGFRIRLAGGKCLYAPSAKARHVGSAVTGRHSDFYVYHSHRNLVWTFVKNMPWPLFWLYLPQHLLLNLVTVASYSLKGRGRIILKSKWDAARGLPAVLRRRLETQRTRKAGSFALRRAMSKGLLRPYFFRGR
ncbi:MAG: glycosyltransferase family 2 protein [Candidatus Nitrospinota bacterium M3_3B_026]